MSSYNKKFFLGVWPFLQIKAKGYGRIKNAPNQKTDATSKMQLFETVNFAFMQKIHLLVKKHRKVNFVIFHRGFTSSNFAQKKKMLQKGVLHNDIVKSKNRANCRLILSNFWHQISAWNIIDYFRANSSDLE